MVYEQEFLTYAFQVRKSASVDQDISLYQAALRAHRHSGGVRHGVFNTQFKCRSRISRLASYYLRCPRQESSMYQASFFFCSTLGTFSTSGDDDHSVVGDSLEVDSVSLRRERCGQALRYVYLGLDTRRHPMTP